jgi:hypothetical protein
VLTDTELAVVGGGGVNLPQDQQKPNQNSTDLVSNTDPLSDDGMDRAPDAVAVFQSEINIDYQRKLFLGETAQQDLRALNLENEVSSDVIGTTNIIGGRLLVPTGTTPRLLFKQTNQLNQLHRQQGHLNSSTAGYSYETTVETKFDYENYNHFASFFVEQRDRNETFNYYESAWDVAVDKIPLPDFICEDCELELLTPSPIELIPGFSIGDVVDLGRLGEYGALANYDGVILYTPGAYLSTGADHVIQANLKIPELDFGSIEMRGCFVDCIEYEKDFGSIGGNIITLESPPLLVDDELNLNTGFVFAGKGRITLLEPAFIKIGGEADFKFSVNLDLVVDLSSIDKIGIIQTALKQTRWEKHPKLDLIDETIPFTLLSFEIAPFDIKFDGVMKAEVMGGTGEVKKADEDTIPPDELQHSSFDYFFRDNSRIESAFTEDVTETSFSESVEHSVLTGGQMTGAEAELLALSEGNLKVNNNSNVSLSGSAQQNMRIVHGVNAVSSIAANSLNVGQMPSFVTGTTRARQVSLLQQNHFIQQR